MASRETEIRDLAAELMSRLDELDSAVAALTAILISPADSSGSPGDGEEVTAS